MFKLPSTLKAPLHNLQAGFHRHSIQKKLRLAEHYASRARQVKWSIENEAHFGIFIILVENRFEKRVSKSESALMKAEQRLAKRFPLAEDPYGIAVRERIQRIRESTPILYPGSTLRQGLSFLP